MNRCAISEANKGRCEICGCDGTPGSEKSCGHMPHACEGK